MNWCCVSLIVAVPNFMTKSADAAGWPDRPQASAASTAARTNAPAGAQRLLFIAFPPIAGRHDLEGFPKGHPLLSTRQPLWLEPLRLMGDPRWPGGLAQALSAGAQVRRY